MCDEGTKSGRVSHAGARHLIGPDDFSKRYETVPSNTRFSDKRRQLANQQRHAEEE